MPAGASNLSINLSGGTGDADMYVKAGAELTESSYDCRPYQSGNTETCTFATPTATTYYVKLKGYSAASGMTLKGSYTTGGGGDGSVLTNAVATAPYSGAASAFKCFTLTVPAGKTSVVFNQVGASGTTGDAAWMSLAPTPPIPDYESAHALQGAAAAQVMKRVFGRDNIGFSACSLTLPAGSTCNDANAVRRRYHGFDQAADENGVSRIYVGFHFRDAVEKGLRHGRQIGEWAFDQALRPQRGR